jgi:hypothetical protein
MGGNAQKSNKTALLRVTLIGIVLFPEDSDGNRRPCLSEPLLAKFHLPSQYMATGQRKSFINLLFDLNLVISFT